MSGKELLKRISALVLAGMMTLSMSEFALLEVFAVPDEGSQTEEPQKPVTEESSSSNAADADGADGQKDEQGTAAGAADGGSGSEAGEGESGDGSASGEADGTQSGQGEGSQTQPETGEGGEQQEPEVPEEPEDTGIMITVAENSDGVMKLTWEPVEGAAEYTVRKEVTDAYDSQQKIDEGKTEFSTDSAEYTFKDLYPGRLYTFSVTATDGSGEVIAETSKPVSEQPKLSGVKTKYRSSRKVNASRMSFQGSTDLRKLIGEKYNGYAVMQGGCTDGTYAYYLMVSPFTQHGRVVKVRMRDNCIVKTSEIVDIWHGNGMCYDSRRHLLVVNARNEASKNVYRKQELTCIDADSLSIVRQQKVKYSHFANDTENFVSNDRSKGIGNIAYIEKYDIYITLQRDLHDLIVFDPDSFEAMGIIRTIINAKYPGLHQAMDADEQYVYQLLSEDGRAQPDNLILALDWNAGQLVDENGHRRQYVPETWECLNGRKPVAVYTINTPHEAENIYHVTDAAGNTHFYLSEYDHNSTYKTKYYYEAYKAKWKKVKKKVRVKVKWKKVKKRVKVKGKWKTKKVWKYRYKWKKKKVWKYKTKYKKVYYKVFDKLDRLAHVYDLGVL